MKNVKWVWTTNVTNHGEGATLTGNYPGDEFVDYISIDGYNWGKSQSKDYEGDWALNTSQDAVNAWKAGIKKMKTNSKGKKR